MKYCVEMSYGLGISVDNIEAESELKAIEIAKQMVEEEVSIIDGKNIDAQCMEFEELHEMIKDKRKIVIKDTEPTKHRIRKEEIEE